MSVEVDLLSALGLPEVLPPDLSDADALQLYLVTRTRLDAAPADIAHARALYWMAKRDVARATAESPDDVPSLKVIMYERRAHILVEIECQALASTIQGLLLIRYPEIEEVGSRIVYENVDRILAARAMTYVQARQGH
jgi:hypothetical protein